MQKKKEYVSVGFIGIVAVVFFGLAWVFAVLQDPTWVFGENMLSDLGESGMASAAYFNTGCFVGGLLIMVFGIGTASFRKRIYSVSGIAVVFAGIFLAMIGLFPSDTGDMHNIFAVGLFAFGTLGMILMTVGDWIHGHVMFGGLSMLMLAAIAITFITQSLAYAEGVTVIVFMIWIALSCVKISSIKENV